MSVQIAQSQPGWFPLNLFTTTNLSHVYFINSSTGIITAYSPVIYRSTNGGTTWNQYVYGNPNIWFWGIALVNESTGWIIGYRLSSPYSNVILKTTNCGENWNEQYSGTGQMREIFFINSQTGFASGDSFYKTTNAGNNWILSSPAGYTSGLALFFWNESTGWIGGNGSASYSIINTTNGGVNWITQLPYIGHVYDFYFSSPLTGFFAGPNGIQKTSNGGQNWVSCYYTNYGVSLSFPNNLSGWATIFVGSPITGKIIKTTDAGYSWVIQNLNETRICYVFMLNVNTGWAIGDEGVIYKTTNGGEPVGINIINSKTPKCYSLYQNYPNPFNPITKIKFAIPFSRGVSKGWGVFVRLHHLRYTW